jgi:hypothetical protein
MRALMLMWTATDASGGDAADFAAWADFEAEAREAGVLIEGARGALEPPAKAKLVTPEIATGAASEVHDGTFPDTDEQIQAFYLLDVADLDAALMWAGKLPTYGRVEVRPMLEY